MACGGGGVFELAECFREKVLRLLELGEKFFGAREIEEIPVFLFLHDFHEAQAGQFDVEDVGALARLEAGGFQVIFAGDAGFPEEREADGHVIGAGDDEGPIARSDVGGDRDGFRADGVGGDGLKLRDLLAVAEDFELDGHRQSNLSKGRGD